MRSFKLKRSMTLFMSGFFFVAFSFGSLAFGAEKKADPLPTDAMAMVKQRQLSPDDVYAAVSTFMPSGKYDDYIMFASGGHSGQVFAIGLPSMRVLRTIAVFTPEPWQGYGYGVKESAIANPVVGGDGEKILWGDSHHPALSETKGEYDGQFLFIGDKAHGRVAVIDLRDYETKQIVNSNLVHNDHGGCFVTPDTEYVIEGSQYAEPLGGVYAPLSEYKEKYRAAAVFWKFNRDKGRIEPENSFAIELPPYWQDLADAGKGPSDGWAFFNSFNTEMATGGIEEGNPPFEAGTTQHDMDYLHVINWKKAEEVVRSGKTTLINNFKVISLQTAIDEGILYFVPEPKSPHGVDVTPSGKYMVVAGKLDPHVTVFGIEKIKKAIADKDFEGKDPFGVPIIRFDSAMVAQVELGLGPLHTQFDNQGYAYTSLFLDSAIARWTLGDDKFKTPEKPWTLVSKTPVQFNVGHIAAAEGDTVNPAGQYLVSLNKWSVDRFSHIGPLLPQNLQLLDISKPGDSLRVMYDLPIGFGEPHYAQIIKISRLKTWDIYPEVGWDALKQSKAEVTALQGRIEKSADKVEIFMPAIRSHFDPEHVEVEEGQKVVWHITNLERTLDATHGFSINGYNIVASIEPGETVTVEFTAKRPGVYPFYCVEFCSALHLEMTGYFLVKPKQAPANS